MSDFNTMKFRPKGDQNDYTPTSLWTHSDTVELPDGSALTNKVNLGVYLSTDSPELDPSEITIAHINDDVISTDSTWSSNKLNDIFQTKASIDDGITDDDKTWSSEKIMATIIGQPIIDDTQALVNKTWSSNKINGYIQNLNTSVESLDAQIDNIIADGTTSDSKTWSSDLIHKLRFRRTTLETAHTLIIDGFGGFFAAVRNGKVLAGFTSNYQADANRIAYLKNDWASDNKVTATYVGDIQMDDLSLRIVNNTGAVLNVYYVSNYSITIHVV